MAEKCKPETLSEEIVEHKQLLKKPAFRAAVAKNGNGKSARKAMGKR